MAFWSSLWSRLRHTARPDHATDDVDEELRLHLEEAVERGRDLADARRALGSTLRHREASRDARVWQWADALRADVVRACRQYRARPVSSAAAVLSLALAAGACAAAFRLADALFWRPLPIARPDRLHTLGLTGVTPDGRTATMYSWAYPQFAEMRDAVRDDATLVAVSPVAEADIVVGSSAEPERARLQFVSAGLFDAFGLRPVAGRVLSGADDGAPAAHPYAVLSEDFWRRRFEGRADAVGSAIRTDAGIVTVVGVVAAPFRGTEPGMSPDVFLPVSMHRVYARDDSTLMRGLALVRPGASRQAIAARVAAVWRNYERRRLSVIPDLPPDVIDKVLSLEVTLTPSPAGYSPVQTGFRSAFVALAMIVVLVLFVACANVANLTAANAASRAREFALRASLGAGRRRLVQLVAVESVMLAGGATLLGLAFSAWAAPAVAARVGGFDHPLDLRLAMDSRVVAFSVMLAAIVATASGLWPAIAASNVRPVAALRGGTGRATRRPVGRMVLGAQVAFCTFVLLLATLLVSTASRLAHRPLGFDADGVVMMDVAAPTAAPSARWRAVADALGATPGVDRVALSEWPLVTNMSWNGFLSVDGARRGDVLGEFLAVSTDFLDVMRVPLTAGRAFSAADTSPGAAIVTEQFVKTFFAGRHPIGHTFLKDNARYEVVGVVPDVVYKNVHEAFGPVAFVPMRQLEMAGDSAVPGQEQLLTRMTLAIRVTRGGTDGAAGDAGRAIEGALRAALHRAEPSWRVSALRSQRSIVDAQTTQERLLAALASFFGGVALALTAVGLYGLLHLAVVERRREIGVRRAVGARAHHVVAALTGPMSVAIAAGLVAGLAAGLLAARSMSALLYGVTPAAAANLALPGAAMLAAAVVAAIIPTAAALRIDPSRVLRTD